MRRSVFISLAILVGLFALLLICTPSSGQVKNPAFDLLIKSMTKNTVPTISVTEASKMENVQFIDTREDDEFRVSHIKGAIHTGYDHFDPASLEMLPRDTTLVLYCSIGVRSEDIGEKLIEMGFKNVYNLYGGIFEWANDYLPVYNSHSISTDTIHAFSRLWGVWLHEGIKVYRD